MYYNRHAVILSEFILEEMREKLLKKLRLPENLTAETVRFLKRRSLVIKAPVNPHIHFEDKNDIPILSLLEASGAHYLITGDKKLLALKKFKQTLILSPREALEIL